MRNETRAINVAGRRPGLPSGFTLVELMIAVSLFGLVVAGSIGVYIMCQRMWRATSLSMDTSRIASVVIERMVYGLGDNSGLRAAASISINTNFHNATSLNYWDATTSAPPAAGHAANNLTNGSPDGSWRITYSNEWEGARYIDYARGQRTIVLWPDTNQPSGRLLIGNYIMSAMAVTTSGGIAISNLIVWKKDGMFTASNQPVSTFVHKRNGNE